jgi:uncharacterized glyoxalase superfamily protein PhnB
MGTSKQTVNAEIIPYIFYRDVPIALDWLARTFGFTEEAPAAALETSSLS